MVASKAESPDDSGIPEITSSKRKSVLKKTFKAIGKVKPKFKSKKNQQMELMNSCASFNFEVSERSEDDDEPEESFDEDLESELTGEEDEGEDDLVEEARKTCLQMELPRRKGTDESHQDFDSKQKAQRGIRSSRVGSDEQGDGVVSSADSTPTSKRRPKLKEPSMMNPTPRLDLPGMLAAEHAVSAPGPSKHSRRKGSGRKSSSESKSPVRQKSPGSKARKAPVQPMPAPDLKDHPTARSPKRENSSSPQAKATSSPERYSSPKSIQYEEKLSTKSLGQRLPQNRPVSIIEEAEDDKDEDDGESLKRLSKAFGDGSAMDGYFAKLQDLKHRDSKPQCYNDKDTETSNQGNSTESGKSEDDKSGRHFKPSKNIKKLFGIRRTNTNPKEGEKTSQTRKSNTEPRSKDEAAKLMLQLGSMLSNSKGDAGERPMKAHTTRPARAFIFDDADDDESRQEFPEIPTEKKTSLSDIRRMMDSSKTGDTADRPQFSRRSSLDPNRPSSTRTQHDHTHRRASMDLLPHDMGETNVCPKDPVTSGQSPTSIAGLKESDSTTNPEENRSRSPIPPAPEDKLLSPGSRKSRDRSGQRLSSGSSDESNRKASSTTRIGDAVSEEGGTSLLKQSYASTRRHKSSRSSAHANEEVREKVDLPVEYDHSVSPGSMRRRKVSHRRHGEKRASSSSSMQPTRSISPSDDSQSYPSECSRDLIKRGGIAEDGSSGPTESNNHANPCLLHFGHRGTRFSASSQYQPKCSASPSDDSCPHRCGKSPDDKPVHSGEGGNAGKSGGTSKSSHHTSHPARRLDTKVQCSPDARSHRKSTGGSEERLRSDRPSSTQNLCRPPLDFGSTRRHSRRLDRVSSESQIGLSREVPLSLEANGEGNETGTKTTQRPLNLVEKAKNPSLAESLEKGRLLKMTPNDGQYSVSTDGGSEMFLKGKMMYSNIRSDDSVGAPQLVIGANDEYDPDLHVKNI